MNEPMFTHYSAMLSTARVLSHLILINKDAQCIITSAEEADAMRD